MGKTYIADKETLDKCYAILSADGIYGFIEHMDVLSPTARIEYIGQNKDFTPISLNKDTGAMTLNSWAGQRKRTVDTFTDTSKPCCRTWDGLPVRTHMTVTKAG